MSGESYFPFKGMFYQERDKHNFRIAFTAGTPGNKGSCSKGIKTGENHTKKDSKIKKNPGF